TVKRPTLSKDFSVFVTGLHGPVIGSRFSTVIVDDVDDLESTSTAGQRDRAWAWITSTLLTRLVEGAKVIAVGTAWHEDDILHRLGRAGWATAKFPVVDPATGEPQWPERWSPGRIAEARATLGPFESARVLDLEVRDDESAL